MRKAIWASLGCFACLHGGLAWGARRGFRPQFQQLTGELEVRTEYREDVRESDTKRKLQKREDFRETLQIQAMGFSYSPKFFTFVLGGGIGLGQSEQGTEQRQSSTKSSVEEYQIIGIFLPEHPYNLEIYSDRQMPMFTSNYSTLKTTSVKRSGVAFNYKQRPYFGEVRYDFSERVGDVSSFTDSIQGYAEYFTDEFVTGMTMSHTSDTVEDDMARSSWAEGYAQLRELFYGKGDYSSTWSLLKKRREDSDSISGSLKHRLDVDIRDDLDGIFELYQDQQRYAGATFGEQATATSAFQEGKATLTHRLFKSLTTSFNALEKIRQESDGTNRNEVLNLTSTYRKRLPASSRVTLGVGIAEAKTNNDIIEGGAAFIPEYFPPEIPLRGRFTTPADVDVSSLKLAVQDDPNLLDDYVDLEEGIHYRILEIFSNGSIEIQLIDVPAGIDPLPGNGDAEDVYKLRVRYQTIKSDDDTKARTWTYTSKLELLDNFLEIYYDRSTTRQSRNSVQPSRVLPEEVVLDDKVGMAIKKDPLSVRWELDRIIGDRQSLRRWIIVAQVLDDIRLSQHLSLEYEGFWQNENIFEERTAGVTMPDYDLLTLYTNVALSTEIPSLDANLRCGVFYEFNRDLKERIHFTRPNLDHFYNPDDELTRTIETDSTLRNYISFSGSVPERRLSYSLSGARILTTGIDELKGWETMSRIRYELGLVKMNFTLRYTTREKSSEAREATTEEETRATLTVSREIF